MHEVYRGFIIQIYTEQPEWKKEERGERWQSVFLCTYVSSWDLVLEWAGECWPDWCPPCWLGGPGGSWQSQSSHCWTCWGPHPQTNQWMLTLRCGERFLLRVAVGVWPVWPAQNNWDCAAPSPGTVHHYTMEPSSNVLLCSVHCTRLHCTVPTLTTE